jgi:hypothetical protein
MAVLLRRLAGLLPALVIPVLTFLAGLDPPFSESVPVAIVAGLVAIAISVTCIAARPGWIEPFRARQRSIVLALIGCAAVYFALVFSFVTWTGTKPAPRLLSGSALNRDNLGWRLEQTPNPDIKTLGFVGKLTTTV